MEYSTYIFCQEKASRLEYVFSINNIHRVLFQRLTKNCSNIKCDYIFPDICIYTGVSSDTGAKSPRLPQKFHDPKQIKLKKIIKSQTLVA